MINQSINAISKSLLVNKLPDRLSLKSLSLTGNVIPSMEKHAAL